MCNVYRMVDVVLTALLCIDVPHVPMSKTVPTANPPPAHLYRANKADTRTLF